ncbi:hypothetical protein ABZY20_09330 [Streptomyces sp. NPDC006624]|uniref:hypothetical protein n=1 Tax=Streptomyces sp. NPDC006624 TaxID=3154892 RepID=UPI00339EF194
MEDKGDPFQGRPRRDSRSDQPAAMEVDVMIWMRAALVAVTAIGRHLLVLLVFCASAAFSFRLSAFGFRL